MSNHVVKTYYLTDQYGENQFPTDFVCSTNKRYIEVHPPTIVRLSAKGVPKEAPKDIMFHSDFVQRDAYLDHGICFCNERRTKYKKYEYRGAYDTFNIWFTYPFPYEITVRYVINEQKEGPYDSPDITNYSSAYLEIVKYITSRAFGDRTEEAKAELYRVQTLIIRNETITKDNLPGLDVYCRYYPEKTTPFHLVDYFVRKYGTPLPDETLSIEVEAPKQVSNTLEYVTVERFIDPNINRYVKKTTTIRYELLDQSKYKFFAEFLPMY